VTHRNEAYFPEPERFVPERWENELEKRLPRYVFMPFGGGPRICIGNAFAMTEAILVLATIAQRYRFEPTGPQRLELVPTVTLRPKGGLPARLWQR
jgi:cytochrome P450